jgi:hypothetical protein
MEVKNDRLTLRVPPCHKAALRSLAKRDGEAMAVVVRRLIRKAAVDAGVWPPTNTTGQTANSAGRESRL